MPCNCDGMEASELEIKASRVLCLLKELQTGKPVDPRSSDWDGYHKQVYNKGLSKEYVDRLYKDLCQKLSKTNTKKYSLELQIWWRDHQETDRRRVEEETAKKKQVELRKAALSKLTKEELNALKELGVR